MQRKTSIMPLEKRTSYSKPWQNSRKNIKLLSEKKIIAIIKKKLK